MLQIHENGEKISEKDISIFERIHLYGEKTVLLLILPIGIKDNSLSEKESVIEKHFSLSDPFFVYV